jgi:IPT/TIG domain
MAASAAQSMLADVGDGFAMIGEQAPSASDATSFTSVGLCEVALEKNGCGLLSLLREPFVPTPLEQFEHATPVDSIDVCPGDDVKIPVYGVVIGHDSPVCSMGWGSVSYSTSEPTQFSAGTLPQGATFLENAQAVGWVFEWTPTADQQGAHTVPLTMSATRIACPMGTTIDTVTRTLTINVSNQARNVAALPVVSSATPAAGMPASTVTITGQSFQTNPMPTVRFNGATATLVSTTPTQIVATVPPGATTGPVTVTTNCDILTAIPTFTVLPSVEVFTQYTVTETLALEQPGMCGPYLTAGTAPNVLVACSSEGHFAYENYDTPLGKCAKTTDGATSFLVVNKPSGMALVSFMGTLGADGSLSSMMTVTPAPGGGYPASCMGDAETWSVAFAPQNIVTWPALVTLAPDDLCASDVGTTDFSASFSIDASNNLDLSIFNIMGVLQGTVGAGGAINLAMAAGAMAPMTLAGALDGTGAVMSGTFVRAFPGPCTETGAFTAVPQATTELTVP